MFVPKTHIGNYRKTDGFPAPFGYPTTCKELTVWCKSEHAKKIGVTKEFPKEFIQQFLVDYETMMRDWVARKVRDRAGKRARGDWDAPDVFGVNFSLDGFKPSDTELKRLRLKVEELVAPEEEDEDQDVETKELTSEQKNDVRVAKSALEKYKLKALLTTALLYFSHNILSPEVRTSLNQLRVIAERKKTLVSWDEAKALVLWGHDTEESLDVLEDFVVLTRSESLHSTPHAWILEVLAHKAKLETADERLSESLYCTKIVRYLSRAEKSEFESDELLTLEALRSAADGMDPQDMPVFR